MTQPSESETKLWTIIHDAPEINTPREVTDLIESVKSNPLFSELVGLGNTKLESDIEQLAFAKSMLSPEIYAAIGEENITHPDMTRDKITVIAWGDIEFDVGGLPLQTVQAMTGPYLAHAGMTVSKLSVLRASPSAIEQLGPQNIAQMSKQEMENALKVWETE